jgi:hypothetical protein
MVLPRWQPAFSPSEGYIPRWRRISPYLRQRLILRRRYLPPHRLACPRTEIRGGEELWDGWQPQGV